MKKNPSANWHKGRLKFLNELSEHEKLGSSKWNRIVGRADEAEYSLNTSIRQARHKKLKTNPTPKRRKSAKKIAPVIALVGLAGLLYYVNRNK
jgi:hypothetical protein